MRLKYLGQVLWVGLLLMSCSGGPDSEPLADQTASQPALSKSATGKTLAQGDFVGSDHDTKGSATLISSDGKTLLEFDQAFKTDQGPDLFVLLHQDAKPETYNPDDYKVVSKLQNTQGLQQYEIPADVDLAKYQSVAIWCKKFNVTFGYAPLTDQQSQG
ncbi:DM13 domain-containing protein [Acaryochloris marina]|uniref:DM13 domain-containing protein n=1 Tax=Acaryochloris marina TaxID=155978 RepID=UPI001BAEC573|nr:DM13 domain-containing protein [Acaryochloris marina]QUY42142.1 DM13 domain-containing protein [Acaryochloris marina S15]